MMVWAGTAVIVTGLFHIILIPIVNRFFTLRKKGSVSMATVELNSHSYVTFALLPSLLFLSTMSLLNFSFCMICSAIIVPLYGLLGNTRDSYH